MRGRQLPEEGRKPSPCGKYLISDKSLGLSYTPNQISEQLVGAGVFMASVCVVIVSVSVVMVSVSVCMVWVSGFEK